MNKGVVKKFLKRERLEIRANNIAEASKVLGRKMKRENIILLNNIFEVMGLDKKKELLLEAGSKLKKLREWSKKEIFVIDGQNRLKKYLEAFDGYCQGSNLTPEEGVLLQIEIDTGCQTLFVQDNKSGTIRFIHSEEDISPLYVGDHYGYKWVEMKLPDQEIAFFAYPGLCGWGPAFGYNLTTNLVQAVDDLIIDTSLEAGVIWANAVTFMTLDLGDLDFIEELVKRIQKIPGLKFEAGYAIQLGQADVRPKIRTVEFARDRIVIRKPKDYGDRLITAQANCPINEKIKPFSLASYPMKNKVWNEHDSRLYVEMRNRFERLVEAGKKTKWPGMGVDESLKEGLKMLANPWGDIGREIVKNTGNYKYYSSGLPGDVMMAHTTGIILKDSMVYEVGKLRPSPIAGHEFEFNIDTEYKFGLKKIWEEAQKERKKYLKNVSK